LKLGNTCTVTHQLAATYKWF